MTRKVESLDDCYSGADYMELAQRKNWRVIPNGSYREIVDERGMLVARFPNCDRTLPKETRGVINAALLKAGLALAVLVAVVVACAAM